MQLSASLSEAIEVVRKHLLNASPQYNISPFHRKVIYNSLDITKLPKGRVKAHLDLITTRYVLPKWFQIWPNDLLPKTLMMEAESILYTSHLLQNIEMEKTWNEIIKRSGEPKELENEAAMFVLIASYKTLETALGIDLWEDVTIDESTLDDLDPEYLDVAKCAADSYSQPGWSERFDGEKRRMFWEWWLNEAIPQAWETAHRL